MSVFEAAVRSVSTSISHTQVAPSWVVQIRAVTVPSTEQAVEGVSCFGRRGLSFSQCSLLGLLYRLQLFKFPGKNSPVFVDVQNSTILQNASGTRLDGLQLKF